MQRSGLNMLFQYSSGFNYTRWEGFGNARSPLESLNFSSTPWTFRMDLKLDKTFAVGPIDLNLYLWMTNVFNTQNVVEVFNTSGDAYDDGWLATQQGTTRTDGYARYGADKGALHEKLYNTLTYDETYFGIPRQIRLGLRIDY